MARFVIESFSLLLVFSLWLVVVALLVRPFGVRLPLNPFAFRERKFSNRFLTLPQHLLVVGVLSWGCGMFIVTTLFHYLDWRYWNDSSRQLSAGAIGFQAVLWPLMGLLFGAFTWKGGADEAS